MTKFRTTHIITWSCTVYLCSWCWCDGSLWHAVVVAWSYKMLEFVKMAGLRETRQLPLMLLLFLSLFHSQVQNEISHEHDFLSPFSLTPLPSTWRRGAKSWSLFSLISYSLVAMEKSSVERGWRCKTLLSKPSTFMLASHLLNDLTPTRGTKNEQRNYE